MLKVHCRFILCSMFKQILTILLWNCVNIFGQHHKATHSAHSASHSHFNTISNETVAGLDRGCKHTTPYSTNSNAQFSMCTGQTDVDLKNGMSIINLIGSRGYLPTCRILNLLLWMASEVSEKQMLTKDTFLDIGANIGSCTVHMASLGFPVISVEPVKQHVDTIRGSIEINPSFHIELHHVGIASMDRTIRANFGHGSRNWVRYIEYKQEKKYLRVNIAY